MATAGSGGAGSGDHERQQRCREIAAGKHPATPFPVAGDDEDPDGALLLLERAISMSSARRQVRQRLFADLNATIQPCEGINNAENAATSQGGVGQGPAVNQETPGPAMATARFQALPRGFAGTIRGEILPSVHLIGDTSLPHLVEVQDINGRFYFTCGWESFVLAERILLDDVGLFIITGPHNISMRLYNRSGLEKPFSSRLVGVDPDEASPAGANVHVPSHILSMEFELGPRVSVNPAIMQQMANIWATRLCNNPLYVCKVIKSHLCKRALYFGTRFSALLPKAYHLPAAVFFGDGVEFIKGAITKTSKTEEMASLSSGFATIAKENGIEVGDVLVIRLCEVEGGYRVRIFKVPA